MDRYQEKYSDIIRIVTSDQNVGMKKNGYRTTKACNGKYIAFCEGDDYWHHPEKMQKQADYLESNPDCGMVYSSYVVYHPESKKSINDFIKYRNWQIPDHWDVESFLTSDRFRQGGLDVHRYGQIMLGQQNYRSRPPPASEFQISVG